MHRLFIPLALAMGLLGCNDEQPSNTVSRALMLKQHGLVDGAKGMFIEIVHSDAHDSSKATSLYHLGLIAFNERQLQAALNTWNSIINQYPNSTEAELVSEQIEYLEEEIADFSSDIVSDVTARLYLKHAEFWSGDIKRTTWTIDTSYLDHIRLACDWYDKVIREFPETDAAKKAHIEKFRTILGESGIQLSFSRYIDPLLTAYHEFEKTFPGDENLPAMKYQVSQAYWKEGRGYLYLAESQKRSAELSQDLAKTQKEIGKNTLWLEEDFLERAKESTAEANKKRKDARKSEKKSEEHMVKAKEWLNQIIENGDSNSFYTRLATARLNEILSKERE